MLEVIPQEYKDTITDKLMNNPVAIYLNNELKRIDQSSLSSFKDKDALIPTIDIALKAKIDEWKKNNHYQPTIVKTANNNKALDYTFNLFVLGDGSVGKTSLIKRYVNGTFDEYYIPSIGIDFNLFEMDINNKKIKVNLFDSFNNTRYENSIQKILKFRRTIHSFILVVDVTNKNTITSVDKQITEIKSNFYNPHIILVATKADLIAERRISDEELQQCCKNYNLTNYFNVSAKSGYGVNSVFEHIIRTNIASHEAENQKEKQHRDKEAQRKEQIKLITKYHLSRQKNTREYYNPFSRFFGGISKSEKLKAANALHEAIQNGTDIKNVFDKNNKALSQGVLGRLYKSFAKQ